MADFCKQCAEEMGFQSDFIDTTLKNGEYNVNLCEGCGPIQTNKNGECISPDCGCVGHNVAPDKNVIYWVDSEKFDFKNIPHKKLESGIWDESIRDNLDIGDIYDIPIIPGYRIYVCWEGAYDLFEICESKQDYKYQHQIVQLMFENYGITFNDFSDLVKSKFNNVPDDEIEKVHERMSKRKIYHILETDNFDGDYPDEHFVSMTDSKGCSFPITFDDKGIAESIAKSFNESRNFSKSRYFMVVEKNYKLKGSFEP